MTSTFTTGDTQFVGIGEYRIGSMPMASIGLGSCVALVIHDQKHCRGGLAHVMLPGSNGRQDRPGKFADTALAILLDELNTLGSRNGSLVAKIAGGASMFQQFSSNLNIGERNIESIKTLIKEKNIKIISEETGGKFGRSVVYYPKESGRMVIRRADGSCVEI